MLFLHVHTLARVIAPPLIALFQLFHGMVPLIALRPPIYFPFIDMLHKAFEPYQIIYGKYMVVPRLFQSLGR
jgi:hypothetical protein